MDSTSRTNGLNGAADWTINLSRARNEDAGVLKVTGRDVPEGEYAVTSDAGRWTIDGSALAGAAQKAAEAKLTAGIGDRSAEIVGFVASHDRPVTPKEVDEALDLPDARRYLARLAEAGRLVKRDAGSTSVPLSQVSQCPNLVIPSPVIGTTGQMGHTLNATPAGSVAASPSTRPVSESVVGASPARSERHRDEAVYRVRGAVDVDPVPGA